MTTRRRCLLAGAVILGACQGERFPARLDPSGYYGVDWAAVLPDSVAGVRLLSWGQPVHFTVADEVLIFPRPGEDTLDAMIGGGRDAQLLPDGRALILGSDGYLLLVARDGRSNVLARRGEGPGELVGPEWLRVLLDGEITVWDGRHRRMSLYHPDSGFVAGFPIPLRTEDGRSVFPAPTSGTGRAFARLSGDFPSRDGVYFRRADVVALDHAGRRGEAVLAGALFAERHIQSLPSAVEGQRDIATFSPPFARSGDVLAGGRMLCYVWAGAPEFACRGEGARGWTVIRDTTPGRPVRPEHLQALLDSVYLPFVAPGRRAAQESAIRAMPTADSMPRWGQPYLDLDDVLWLPRYATIPEREQEVLLIRDGVVEGVVRLPRQDRVLWARGQQLIVMRRDPDRVRQFYLLSLRRLGA